MLNTNPRICPKEKAMKELTNKTEEMKKDAQLYIKDAKKHKLDVSEAEELLEKAKVEFATGDYELSLRDVLGARQTAIDMLKTVNPKINAKNSNEIWNHFISTMEKKFNKIFWMLDKFNEFIDKCTGLEEISIELGQGIKILNEKIRLWVEISDYRLTVPLGD